MRTYTTQLRVAPGFFATSYGRYDLQCTLSPPEAWASYTVMNSKSAMKSKSVHVTKAGAFHVSFSTSDKSILLDIDQALINNPRFRFIHPDHYLNPDAYDIYDPQSLENIDPLLDIHLSLQAVYTSPMFHDLASRRLLQSRIRSLEDTEYHYIRERLLSLVHTNNFHDALKMTHGLCFTIQTHDAPRAQPQPTVPAL